jgi:hypothetical protein
MYVDDLFKTAKKGELMNKTASNARLKASLEELARCGCPVDLSVAVTEVENEKVEIEQVGVIYFSQIFELQDGRVAYMADIAVTNLITRTIDVVDVELRTPWNDSFFQWLTPLQFNFQGRRKRDRGYSYKAYQFPGEAGLQFDYDQVINHLLVERRKLPGQRRLQGWLLGIGGRMAAELCHGKWFDLPLAIIAADHGEYSTTLRLLTQRLQGTKSVKTRTSIFAKPVEEEAVVGRDVTCTAPLPASQSPTSNRT